MSGGKNICIVASIFLSTLAHGENEVLPPQLGSSIVGMHANVQSGVIGLGKAFTNCDHAPNRPQGTLSPLQQLEARFNFLREDILKNLTPQDRKDIHDYLAQELGARRLRAGSTVRAHVFHFLLKMKNDDDRRMLALTWAAYTEAGGECGDPPYDLYRTQCRVNQVMVMRVIETRRLSLPGLKPGAATLQTVLDKNQFSGFNTNANTWIDAMMGPTGRSNAEDPIVYKRVLQSYLDFKFIESQRDKSKYYGPGVRNATNYYNPTIAQADWLTAGVTTYKASQSWVRVPPPEGGRLNVTGETLSRTPTVEVYPNSWEY